jgi:hypothetical protein
MTDAEKIELLRAKLEETLSENDKLRALVERLTEGASAHATLQELHRNRDLPPAGQGRDWLLGRRVCATEASRAGAGPGR